jgi:hypothetical protein
VRDLMPRVPVLIIGGVRTDAFVNAFLKPCHSQAFRRGYGAKGLHFETLSEPTALALDAQGSTSCYRNISRGR